MDTDNSEPMDTDNSESMDTDNSESMDIDNSETDNSEPIYDSEVNVTTLKFYIDENKTNFFDIKYKEVKYEDSKLFVPLFEELIRHYDLSLSNKLYLRHTYFIYFLTLLKLHAQEYNVNVCYNTPANEFSILEYINIDLNDYEINIQNENYEYIYYNGQQCDLIIFPIAIFSKYTRMKHINVAIIDNYLKTIEYFEPHGNLLGIHSEIPNLVGNFLKKKFTFLNDYTYLQRDTTHQLQQADSFCELWCLYVIWLRVLNYKNYTTDNIETYLLSNGYERNILDLKSFLSLIEEIVKKQNIPYNLSIKLNNINLFNDIPESSETYNVIKELLQIRTIELKKNILNKELLDQDIVHDLLSFVKFKDFDKTVYNSL